MIIVFIQENQHHKVCFSEGPWETIYIQKLYNKIMHAGFKVYKYKIIIYYKGELQGKTIVYVKVG